MNVYILSDRAWEILQPLLPVNRRGPKRRNDRRLISGMIHRAKYGGRWCDLPEIYGPWITVYRFHRRLAQLGTWDEIFDTVSTKYGGHASTLILDSTYVSAHRQASGGKGGS